MKLDILAIGVHPDDVELSSSGTLLKHINMGYKVGLLDLTKGELGSRGTPEIRAKEAQNSAQLMGAKVRENVGLKDGFIAHTEESMRAIIPYIRAYQPDIILANALSDRHPDHGRAAKIVADACFLAGLVKIETSWKGVPQEKWRPKAIYHYIQDHQLHPDFVVDISPYLEKKMELILTFRSQFFTGEEAYSQEPQTPISGKDFMDFMRAKARVFGRMAGYEYAEGFNLARPMGIPNLLEID